MRSKQSPPTGGRVRLLVGMILFGMTLAWAQTPTWSPVQKVIAGYVDSSTRQVVRTADNVVYLCINGSALNSSAARLRMMKGDAANPTTFSEQDASHAPADASRITGVECKLADDGIIHVIYTQDTPLQAVYSTFDTGADTWGEKQVLGAINGTNHGRYYSHVALVLDSDRQPHVIYAGTNDPLQYRAKLGGVWSNPVTITPSETYLHPSAVFDATGTLHLAIYDMSSYDRRIAYRQKPAGGSWSTLELIAHVDNSNDYETVVDQSPSIVLDGSGLPVVLYIDNTTNGSYVKLVRRQGDNQWADISPPVSKAVQGHSWAGYVQSDGRLYACGHDLTDIEPYCIERAPDGTWGEKYALASDGIRRDGSASLRYDPLWPGPTDHLDYVTMDENSLTAAQAWYLHGTVITGPPPAPSIIITPSTLTFSATAGGADPPAQVVNAASSGSALGFTITSDVGWLSAVPTVGTTPQTVQVFASIAGLAAGSYAGHLQVMAEGSADPPRVVTITLTVNAPPPPPQPVLALSSTALSFSAVENGSNPPSQTIVVTNSGTGTLTFAAAPDVPWLSVTPASGSAPQNLQVSAAVAGLTAGTYSGHFTVTAANAQNSPIVVTVTFAVTSPPPPPQPVLALSSNALTFSATEGGSNPPVQTLNVTNSGSGTLTFTAVSDATWLSVTPASGSAPRTLQVAAVVTGRTAGTYIGHITVTAAGAQNSPAMVTVTFSVAPPPPPILTVSPTALSFSAVEGGANPAANTVSVTNSGTGNLTFSATSDAAWLSVAPASGTAPQNLQVSSAVAGLTAGAYTGHITVTAAGAQNSPTVVTVTFSVTAPPPLPVILLGTPVVQNNPDYNPSGMAEAFQATAAASGTLTMMYVYLDAGSTASSIVVGLYTNSNTNHPATRLTLGTITQPVAGRWNAVSVSATAIASGTKYWIAMLGTTSGTLRFRDRNGGSCKSETSRSTTLATLPATWTTGSKYNDCPVSAYGQ